MKISRSARRALGLAAAAAMLAGCGNGAFQGGLGSSLPATQIAARPNFARPKSVHPDQSRSRMSPTPRRAICSTSPTSEQMTCTSIRIPS